MSTSLFGLGFLKLVLLLSGGGILGMPPGQRDPGLVKCAPAEAIVYREWSSRAPGKPGAPGIDGLAADPEVVAFVETLKQAVLRKIRTDGAKGSVQAEVYAETLPHLALALLDRPGCVYATFDVQAAKTAEAPEGFPGVRGRIAAGLRIALVVSGGDKTDEIAKHIKTIVALFPAEIRSENLEHQKIPGLPPQLSVTLHKHEKYFILGLGEGAIDAAVKGLKGEAPSLAAQDRFSQAMQRVQIERTSGVAWIDVRRAIEVAAQSAGAGGEAVNAIAGTLNLNSVDYVASAAGLVEGQLRSRRFINTAGSTEGILALAAGRGITADDLKRIPADADLVFAVSLNAPKTLEALRKIVATAGPAQSARFEELIEQLELLLDAKLNEQIFPGFDDVWTVYDSPGAGGMFFTSPVAAVKVKDHRQAYLAYTGALDLLKGELTDRSQNDAKPGNVRRGVFLERYDFQGEAIWYLNTVGRSDTPFSPAFCMTQEELLVAPHPQAIKAHLRFRKSDQPTFASKLGKEIPTSDGDLLCLHYVESREWARLLTTAAPYLGNRVFAGLQEQGINVRIADLPSPRAVLPYVDNSFGTVTRTKDGLMIEAKNGIGLPLGTGVFLSWPGWRSD